jgi:hypothetical protein
MDYSENITELRPSAYAKYEEKQILDAPLVAPQLTVVFEQRYRNLPGPLCSSDIAFPVLALPSVTFPHDYVRGDPGHNSSLLPPG